MDDLISRQAAIDALHMHLMYRMGTDRNKKRLDEWINNLPSARPEQRWIPCSEWLPEQRARVLTCSKDGNIWINDYNPIAPTAWAIEPWAVIAWMPLPESYKEGQDERHD